MPELKQEIKDLQDELAATLVQAQALRRSFATVKTRIQKMQNQVKVAKGPRFSETFIEEESSLLARMRSQSSQAEQDVEAVEKLMKEIRDQLDDTLNKLGE